MFRLITFVGFLGAATLFSQQQAPVQPGKTNLKVGDTAPDFELNSSFNKKIKLSDYRGKTVVLAFFYRARTKG